jgi:hypothetical protein
MTNDTPQESLRALKIRIDLDYSRRLREYEMYAEGLRIQREQFLKDNPDHPYKETMFMQVCAPPQKVTINIIE